MSGGDGYANPIIGGLGTLIRDNIRSQNYVAGTSGWAIFANGFAEFLNVVVRGGLRSANYVAGVSGYNLDGATGSAELNDATIRGDVFFPTGDANVTPGSIRQVGTELSLQSPKEPGVANPAWVLLTPLAQLELRGAPIFLSAPTGSAASERIVWATSEMTLQVDGPAVLANLRLTGASDAAGPLSTTSTAYVSLSSTANLTMPYPASGIVAVTVAGVLSASLAAGRSLLGFEIRDTSAAGTLRVAGTVARSASSQGTDLVCSSRTVTVGGLPTTGTMFVRAMFRSSTTVGNTGNFEDVRVDVVPSP